MCHRGDSSLTGKYRFDGTEFVVDGASSPTVAGEQIRQVQFDSPTRIIVTAKNIPKDAIISRVAALKLVLERVLAAA